MFVATMERNARHQLVKHSTWKTAEGLDRPGTAGAGAIGPGAPCSFARVGAQAHGRIANGGNVQSAEGGSVEIPHSVRNFQTATGQPSHVSDGARTRIWNPLAVRWIGFLRQSPAPDTSPARRHECLPTLELVS